MDWCFSHCADPAARALADRHYSRQRLGSRRFVGPGRNVVFLSRCGRAYWVTTWPFAEYVRHRWAGAWICAAFRNEGAGVSSELIRQAVAATKAFYGLPPALGMITFIDRREVRPTFVKGEAVWGWTFRKAGFVEVGETKVHRLLALQLLPDAMPAAEAAGPRSVCGLPLFGYRNDY